VKKIIGIAAASAFALAALGAPVSAAPPAGVGEGAPPAGIQCQQNGIATLQSLKLLPAVAKNGIEVVDVGVVDFQTVLKLHRTSPELFRSGTGVTVVVPGVGEVPATWCDL